MPETRAWPRGKSVTDMRQETFKIKDSEKNTRNLSKISFYTSIPTLPRLVAETFYSSVMVEK